jgi:hypothetical protein
VSSSARNEVMHVPRTFSGTPPSKLSMFSYTTVATASYMHHKRGVEACSEELSMQGGREKWELSGVKRYRSEDVNWKAAWLVEHLVEQGGR